MMGCAFNPLEQEATVNIEHINIYHLIPTLKINLTIEFKFLN